MYCEWRGFHSENWYEKVFQKKDVDFYLNANWCFHFLLKKTKRKDWSYFYHQINTDWALCWWSTELFSIFSELRPVWCLLPFFLLRKEFWSLLMSLFSKSIQFFQLRLCCFWTFSSYLSLPSYDYKNNWIWSFLFAHCIFNYVQITLLIVEIKYISSMDLSAKTLSHKDWN